MSQPKPLTRAEIAYLVAHDLPDGVYVNLGIGMPTMVSDYLPTDREIILHSENGILGSGRPAVGDEIDRDLINASRTPVTLLPGASITEHTVSFAMMRRQRKHFAGWRTDVVRLLTLLRRTAFGSRLNPNRGCWCRHLMTIANCFLESTDPVSG